MKTKRKRKEIALTVEAICLSFCVMHCWVFAYGVGYAQSEVSFPIKYTLFVAGDFLC
jgi:hypothetical protein